MEPQDPSPPGPPAAPPDPRMAAMLELKRQMEELHAQVEYLRLLLKMGVGVR